MSKEMKTTYEKMKETGKHGIIYGLTSTLTTSLAVILVPLYTRYIDTDDYGLLALLVITASIFTTIFSFGILKSFFRFYFDSNNDKNRNEVTYNAFTLSISSNTMMVVIVTILSPLLSLLIMGEISYYYFFILLTVEGASLNISYIGLALFRAQRKSGKYSKIYISNFILRLILIICFVVVFNLGILGIVIGKFISSIVLVIVVLSLNIQHLKFRYNKNLSLDMIKFGVPFIFISITTFVLTWFDRYFINIFQNLSDVGVYNVGYQIGSVMMVLFISPFNFIWSSLKFEVMNQENKDHYYEKIFLYFAFLSFFLFLIFSLLNYEPIHLIIDSRYWDSYKVIPLVTLGIVFFGLNSIIHLGISFTKKTQYIFYITLTGSILNILLNIFFIPYYGMIGAAFTTFISYIVMFCISFIVNDKLYSINYKWSKFNWMLIIAGILFIFGWFFPFYEIIELIGFERYSIISYIIAFISKGIIVISFPLMVWLLNIFEKEDKEGLFKLLRDIRSFFKKG